jgi:FkbM family methyltransferase
MYKEYFESIQNLAKPTGWYTEKPDRKDLDWLKKEQPTTPTTFREVLSRYNRFKGRKINFLQIGAMDGVKHDDLYQYVMNNYWTGVLVEPLPDMFERLLDNYAHKTGLKFENTAISKEDGTAEIYRIPTEKIKSGVVPDWADGCTTLLPDNHLEDLRQHMVPQIIRTITYKTLLEKYNTKFDFIQVDTEGFDYEIFLQIMQNGLTADLYKIEIAHITQSKAVWMKWVLDQQGYKTFIDGYDLIAYRF